MPRTLVTGLFAALIAALLMGAAPAAAASPTAALSVPASATLDRPVAVTVSLPAGIAAVDGRLYVKREVAEVLGVAPVGKGRAFRPVDVPGGVAFGAFGLRTVDGKTTLRVVVVPKKIGRIKMRVILDAAADADGRRIRLAGADRFATLGVSGGARLYEAPTPSGRTTPARTARAAREFAPDGIVDKRDLDGVRVGWEVARLTGATCAASEADANGDGCVDIVDVQAVLAAQGDRTATPAPRAGAAGSTPTGSTRTAASAALRTFVVTSPVDTADAAPGNGTCADSLGRCTLRAAMTEADYLQGEDRIEFNLVGAAPVLIQLSSRLPIISSRSGGVTIDGYSQPGSRVNDATFGSNAIPGIELRGNGNTAREFGFYITSGGNTIRGFAMHNTWRPVFIDGVDAQANRIVGNWVGFRRDGTLAATGNNFAVTLNTGAHDNIVGTPNLADRNVLGNYSHAIESYGPGTNRNVLQGNLLCIRPNGVSVAQCDCGIDHNFGPKDSLIGGTGPNEANVIGPTRLQGIELSHGWDPALPYGTDTATTYQINGHRVVGNWVGFRGDGSYDAAFRSGNVFSSSDNGQAINVYDGSNYNIVEGNYIGSVFDGIQVMAPNARGNIVRGNIIGQSPQGQAAPMSGWGVKLRWSTKQHTIEANTIRNATTGGIGLVENNVYNIRISRNIVMATNGPAIDLYGAAGPDPNDPGDGDMGANILLNTPEFTSVTTTRARGTANGGATVELYRASRPVGQYGLPIEFLGSTTAASDGTWSVPVTLASGDVVTALQILPDNNTSELAANVAVAAAPPPPQPGDLLASDLFDRTVTGAWGAATPGGTWALTGTASDFSVSGGAGRISTAAGQTREARLNVDTADVAVAGQLAFDRLPTSSNVYAYILARRNGSTAYRAAIRVASTGAVYVQLKKAVNAVESNVAAEVQVTGLTAAAGRPLAFRFKVVGSNLQFRVWDAAGFEPDVWQTQASDTTSGLQGPGAAGIRSFTGGPVPNGPVVLLLDTFEVRRG